MPKAKPPSDEEFEAWLDHPVTQFVMDAYDVMADLQKAAWLDLSWQGGHPDPEALIELRTRADAYRSISEMELSDLITVNAPDGEPHADQAL